MELFVKGKFEMYEDELARVALFSTLNKKELEEVAKSCQKRVYPAGTVIFAQGDIGVGLYVVIDGKVRISQITSMDKAEEDLGTAVAGEVLGEMALLDDHPRSATVTALDEVTALLLPVWEFRSVLRGHPDIALSLLSVMSKRLRKSEARQQEW